MVIQAIRQYEVVAATDSLLGETAIVGY